MSLQSAKLCYVLPRGMAYAQNKATSIDLFVSEIVAHSRFDASVIAESSNPHLPAPQIIALPRYRFANSLRRAKFIAQQVAYMQPALVVVEQHLPSAGSIGARISQPTMLQKHNFIKPPRPGLSGVAGRHFHRRQFQSLAGITLVSETVQRHFEQHWPEVDIPRCVINNGIETKLWIPSPQRDKTILTVGRAAPEKGLLEVGEALLTVLPKHPDWTATLVLSETKRHPDYLEKLRRLLAPLERQIIWHMQVPFAVVKEQSERAAIALIASKWEEPFGRTCVEAHAGGAAVISSGTGGLREISGEDALYLKAVSPQPIAEALSTMIEDEALRLRLAQAGRARVTQLFDLAYVAGKFDGFCAQIIDKSRSKTR